jgi:hypothetical protein
MDPSGGGLLTTFGREEGEEVLPMRYGAPPSDETIAKRAGVAWGLVKPPDWLLVGAALRLGFVGVKVDPGPLKFSPALMQADLRAGVRAGGFRASASLGAVDADGTPASLAGPLISREHWVGYSFASDELILRAGRLNVPFGLRTVEHTFWVRQTTRTDINDTQQHGLAIAHASAHVRAELMGILGNFQVSPAGRREQGYSGYVEVMPLPWAGAGASSLITHADFDPNLHAANTRQAHGLFARVGPVEQLALLGEADLLIDSPHGLATTRRWVGLLQVNVEPKQGLQFLAAGEALSAGLGTTRSSWGGWLGINYFFWSHCDARVDVVRQAIGFGDTRVGATSLVLQVHLYL